MSEYFNTKADWEAEKRKRLAAVSAAGTKVDQYKAFIEALESSSLTYHGSNSGMYKYASDMLKSAHNDLLKCFTIDGKTPVKNSLLDLANELNNKNAAINNIASAAVNEYNAAVKALGSAKNDLNSVTIYTCYYKDGTPIK